MVIICKYAEVMHCNFYNNPTDFDKDINIGTNIYMFNPGYKTTSTYELLKSSQCIDIGTAEYSREGTTVLNIPSSDYSGKAPDLGAKEYNEIAIISPFVTMPLNIFTWNNRGTSLISIYSLNGQKIISYKNNTANTNRIIQKLSKGLYIKTVHNCKTNQTIAKLFVKY